MYLAQGEADLHEMIMNDNQFGYRIKITGKSRCKLATSCGTVIDFTITDKL